MTKVAVLGAAFNPPTLGHKDIILQCLQHFDDVWLVPAYQHAFGKNMLVYSHRLAMLREFVKDLALEKVTIKDCEEQIHSSGPVYSIDLMRHLSEQYNTTEYQFSLILGPDNQDKFDLFKDSGILKKKYSPFIVKEQLAIRSTLVRKCLEKGEAITSFVTPRVARYIEKHTLYSPSVYGVPPGCKQ